MDWELGDFNCDCVLVSSFSFVLLCNAGIVCSCVFNYSVSHQVVPFFHFS